MKLQEVLEEIIEICRTCEVCEPSCTGNILKKYIEDRKPDLKAA